MAKETITNMKKEPTIWENIFANDTLENGLISNYIKSTHNFTLERQTIQLKIGQRT